MVRSRTPVNGILAAVLLIAQAFAPGRPAHAEDNTFHGNVLQSGHVGTDWRHFSASDGGLSLTFQEQDAVRNEARRKMRHHIKDIVDDFPFPHFSLLTQASPILPGHEKESPILGLFGDDIGVTRTVLGWELDARPFARLKADLDEAEARTGIRIRWGRGLSSSAEDGRLRAYLYTDWEARAGVDGFLGRSRTTGGHDLDSGLALAFGGWSVAVEANLAGSGFSHHEEDSAAAYVGYAIRF